MIRAISLETQVRWLVSVFHQCRQTLRPLLTTVRAAAISAIDFHVVLVQLPHISWTSLKSVCNILLADMPDKDRILTQCISKIPCLPQPKNCHLLQSRSIGC